jgi:UDP-GlcNAc:undecaprenyl-phosphate GlcNAc-1-phosphate transferase
MEVHLQGSANWPELWGSLKRRAAELGLRNLRLDVNAPAIHEGYHARWDRLDADGEAPLTWCVDIPLMVRGQRAGRLEIGGDRNHAPVWETIAAAGRLVEEVEQVVALLSASGVNGVEVPPPPDPPVLDRSREDVLAEQVSS